MKGKPLFTMELSGGPRERGFRYGEACRRLVGRMVDEAFYEEFGMRASKEQMLKHARKYAPFIEDYSPEIGEELKGIAEGSGRSYEEVIMANSLEEREGYADHCTCFAATGRATKDGLTYTGQTWDGSEKEWWDGEFGLLFKVRPKEGPDILDYTNPGILACAGMNSRGITLNWNTVPQLEMAPGVPTYIIVAEVLKQKTIGDAIDAVRRAKRAGYFNFVITDETELYSIEGTPREVEILYSHEHLGHTNHFVSEKFKEKQNVTVSAGSIVRFNRINRFLKENNGLIELKTCMGFFRDHVNSPHSICSHGGTEAEATERGLTLDAWISVPAKKEFWIAHGPPCETEFVKYEL